MKPDWINKLRQIRWEGFGAAVLFLALVGGGFQNCGKSGFRSVSSLTRFRDSSSSNLVDGGAQPSPRDPGTGDSSPYRPPSPAPSRAPSPSLTPSLGPVSQETTVTSIQGVWRGVCGYNSTAQQYMQETLSILAGTMNSVTDYSRSVNCGSPVQRLDYRGTYTVETTNSTGQPNQLRFGYSMQDSYETYFDPNYLAQLNNGNVCGNSQWTSGVPVNVRGLPCALPDANMSNGRIQKFGNSLTLFFTNGQSATYVRTQ